MNAVLTFPVFRQGFQLISGRHLELCENPDRIQLIKLSDSYSPEQPGAELPGLFCVPAIKDVFRVLVFERLNHDDMLAR